MEILEMNRISPANSIQPSEAGCKEKTGLPALCRGLAKPLPEAGTDSRFIRALSGRSSITATSTFTHRTSEGTERIIHPLDRPPGERNAKNKPSQIRKNDKFIWIFNSWQQV